jgi:two-component system, cell cycle response regulator
MKRIENSVLVIDDDPEITRLLYFILSRAGFQVIQKNDGFNACRWLLDHIPDVIICDILIPEMGGMEILSYIRNMRHIKGVPVIALTALTLTGYREKFLKHGFDAYYTKPVDINKFADEAHRFTRCYLDEKRKVERSTPDRKNRKKQLVQVKGKE